MNFGRRGRGLVAVPAALLALALVAFAVPAPWGGDCDAWSTMSFFRLKTAEEIRECRLAGDDILKGGSEDDRLYGGAGSDVLSGGTGDDVLDGGDGTDVLWGDAGDDVLDGGAGADRLHGGAGADSLRGGPGADVLDGGAGGDTMAFGRGDGSDAIVADGFDAASTDRLLFGAGVDADDLWFRREGDDLAVRILGSDDRVALEGWFEAGKTAGGRLDRFETASGKVLTEARVRTLVDAMAAWRTVPDAMPADAALAAALDAAWR